MRIGSGAQNDVVLSDFGVSAAHLVIVEREGRCFVTDLGSSNGTLLNGQRVTGLTELATGDSLGLGLALLQFVHLEPGEAEAEGPSRKQIVPAGHRGSARTPTGEHPVVERTGLLGPIRGSTGEQWKHPAAGAAADGEEVITSPGEDEPTNPLSKDPRRDHAQARAQLTTVPARGGVASATGGTLQQLPPVPSADAEASASAGTSRDLPPVPSRSAATSATAGTSKDLPPVPPSAGWASATAGTSKDLPPVPPSAGSAPATAGTSRDLPPIPSAGGAASATAGTSRQLPPVLPESERDRATGPIAPVQPFAQLFSEAGRPVAAPAQLEAVTAPRPADPGPPVVGPAIDRERITDRSLPQPGAVEAATELGVPLVVLEGPTDARAVNPLLQDESTGKGLALPGRLFDEDEPTISKVTEEPRGELASDRARRRRLAGDTLGAQLVFFFGELPARVRLGVGLALMVALLVVVSLLRPAPGPALPPEPTTLQVAQTVTQSFGLGDGVDYPQSDQKEFKFNVSGPTDVAVVVHFQAQDIAREEVAVSSNGVPVGYVPPDVGLPDRDLEVLISQFVVKRNAQNTVVFDNVKNPPGKNPWRIWRLSLEVLPVPEGTPQQALAAATELFERASQLEKQRDLGDDSGFRAWHAYRQAWISLLRFREDERPRLFSDARRRADTLKQELDQRCGTLLLDAKKQVELKNPERAKEILDEVPRYFPTGEHRCSQVALEKAEEYQL